MNQKNLIRKIYSEENTGDDVLFGAVADMWAYSFSKRDSITDILQNIIFTEQSWAIASDFL